MKNNSAQGEKNLIGPAVSALRKSRGLTRRELLSRLHLIGIDISISSLSALERQKRKVRDFEVAAIADVFGVSPDDLFPSGGC